MIASVNAGLKRWLMRAAINNNPRFTSTTIPTVNVWGGREALSNPPLPK